MFRELGATVVDADEGTHAVYASGTPGFDAVVREFGPEYVRGGEINRARLGQLVFKDRGARERLNAIVHPLVRQWMADRTADAFDRGAQVVIEDVPLLFENWLQGPFHADGLAAHVKVRENRLPLATRLGLEDQLHRRLHLRRRGVLGLDQVGAAKRFA